MGGDGPSTVPPAFQIFSRLSTENNPRFGTRENAHALILCANKKSPMPPKKIYAHVNSKKADEHLAEESSITAMNASSTPR
ncbi:hypothetical protein PLICRDRAFT_179494 [Plicaturopsis crispa FD-325 SS-3]|uniref:Uncharacterized protein n=1 Tax=Plicaturopsis crispa FD-325 SS-3 TaxID=944288 RepID=A0A0C9T8Y0_PLICR|nr:hypothetical protein PLICRDRAFT_179494 [Plicaturopsis crispa FD-325 SS-3]